MELDEGRAALKLRAAEAGLGLLRAFVAGSGGPLRQASQPLHWYASAQRCVCRLALADVPGSLLASSASARLAVLQTLAALVTAQGNGVPQPLAIAQSAFQRAAVRDPSAEVAAFARGFLPVLSALCRPLVALTIAPPFDPDEEEKSLESVLAQRLKKTEDEVLAHEAGKEETVKAIELVKDTEKEKENGDGKKITAEEEEAEGRTKQGGAEDVVEVAEKEAGLSPPALISREIPDLPPSNQSYHRVVKQELVDAVTGETRIRDLHIVNIADETGNSSMFDAEEILETSTLKDKSQMPNDDDGPSVDEMFADFCPQ